MWRHAQVESAPTLERITGTLLRGLDQRSSSRR
jgi:hypothetical protein